MEDALVLDNVRWLVNFYNLVFKAGSPPEPVPASITLKDIETHGENSPGPFPDGPVITVRSIADEYRHIVQERCTCGGAFVSNLQATASSALGQFDDINAACRECGSVHQFKFFLGSDSSRPRPHLA
jgi:hypothetical protein